MTDPIADMLTRIRNAAAVRKTRVAIPFSRLKWQIAELLAREGWVQGIEKIEGQPVSTITIILKYDERGLPVVRSLRRVSKPGRRVYVSKENLPTVMNHFGMAVLSTSKGLMTNRDARKAHIGGEVLCEIA